MAIRETVLRCLAFASALVLFASMVSAADPDSIQDFCVASGSLCKDPSIVVPEDFVFGGLAKQGNLSSPFGAPLQKAFVAQFPGINTLGISFARLDFAYPGGLNVPHWHQRASEILYCVEGDLLVGFVDTNNKLWSNVLHAGDITVFPRGLVHFQLNVGTTVAHAVLSLNSQNPGRSDVGASTFGSGVDEQVLETAFNFNAETVKELENFFSGSSTVAVSAAYS